MSQPAALLAELSCVTGIEMTFDEFGLCILQIDGVMLTLRSKETSIVLYGMLGTLANQDDPAIWRHLLAFNTSLIEANRGAVALDEETGSLLLMQAIDAATMAVEALSEQIIVFLEQSATLIALIRSELPTAFSGATEAHAVTATI